MKKYLLRIFLFLSVAQAFGQTYQIDTIQYAGHSEDVFDLVIVAEGYTEAQLELFRADAKKVPDIMKLNNAYESLMDEINIFSISTPSVDSGISFIALDPQPSEPIQVTEKKNTFFGIYFQNSYRAYFLDDSIQLKAKHVVGEHIPFHEVALILTNDPIGSGRAAFNGVAVAHRSKGMDDKWAAYVINHELAHSIGGLSDAYDTGKEEGFNKTTNSNPNTIRWKHLLSSDEVSIDSITPGVYIPNTRCMMIDFNENYTCPVCRERIKNSMTNVGNHLPTPHRLYHLESDTINNTQTFEWDPIPGATHYEVVYHLFWKNEVLFSSSETNQITLSLSREDMERTIYALPGTNGNWGTSLSIRAYNASASTYFARYSVNVNFEEQVAIPEIAEISKSSETAYRLDFIQNNDRIQAILIRLYNETGHFADIVTPKKSIELRGLKKDHIYQFQVAAVYPDNLNLNNSSPLSPLMRLEVDSDKDGFTASEDCDDTNNAINPNQTEIAYNGLDDDCNAATLDDDLDQDGFVLADDCDDTNSAINPNAMEIVNNDIDEDCDGTELISGTYELAKVTLKIYPNPATDYIQIAVEGQLKYSVKLFDLSGKLIQNSQNSSMLDLSNLSQGTYLLEIAELNTRQRVVERIVVTK